MAVRRLDEIVAGLLPGLRAMVVEEEKAGAVVEAAPEFAARGRGGDETRAGGTGAHPRSSSRSMAKRAAMTNAKRETAAP